MWEEFTGSACTNREGWRILFVALAVWLPPIILLPLSGIAKLFLYISAIFLTFIVYTDAKNYVLPLRINVGAWICAIGFLSTQLPPIELARKIVFVLGLMGVLWIISSISNTLGQGDVILLGTLGILTAPIEITVLLGGYGIAMLSVMLSKQDFSPLGPSIILGTLFTTTAWIYINNFNNWALA